MLSTVTEGWYLYCYKYKRRDLNLYPSIYFRESSFLFRENSKIQLNHQTRASKARQVF